MRKYLDQSIEVLTAVMMSLMIGTVTLQVFSRYVLLSPIGWTEEISGFALVWVSFLGSYLGFRRSVHLRIEIVYLLLPKGGRRISLIVGDLALIGFSLFLVFEGIPYARQFMYLLSPNLQLPMGISYSVVPLTGILFLSHLLPETYQLVFQPDTSPFLNKALEIAEEAKIEEAKIE